MRRSEFRHVSAAISFCLHSFGRLTMSNFISISKGCFLLTECRHRLIFPLQSTIAISLFCLPFGVWPFELFSALLQVFNSRTWKLPLQNGCRPATYCSDLFPFNKS